MMWNEDEEDQTQLESIHLLTPTEAYTLQKLLAKSQGLDPQEVQGVAVVVHLMDGTLSLGGSVPSQAAVHYVQAIATDHAPCCESIHELAQSWADEYLNKPFEPNENNDH